MKEMVNASGSNDFGNKTMSLNNEFKKGFKAGSLFSPSISPYGSSFRKDSFAASFGGDSYRNSFGVSSDLESTVISEAMSDSASTSSSVLQIESRKIPARQIKTVRQSQLAKQSALNSFEKSIFSKLPLNENLSKQTNKRQQNLTPGSIGVGSTLQNKMACGSLLNFDLGSKIGLSSVGSGAIVKQVLLDPKINFKNLGSDQFSTNKSQTITQNSSNSSGSKNSSKSKKSANKQSINNSAKGSNSAMGSNNFRNQSQMGPNSPASLVLAQSNSAMGSNNFKNQPQMGPNSSASLAMVASNSAMGSHSFKNQPQMGPNSPASLVLAQSNSAMGSNNFKNQPQMGPNSSASLAMVASNSAMGSNNFRNQSQMGPNSSASLALAQSNSAIGSNNFKNQPQMGPSSSASLAMVASNSAMGSNNFRNQSQMGPNSSASLALAQSNSAMGSNNFRNQSQMGPNSQASLVLAQSNSAMGSHSFKNQPQMGPNSSASLAIVASNSAIASGSVIGSSSSQGRTIQVGNINDQLSSVMKVQTSCGKRNSNSQFLNSMLDTAISTDSSGQILAPSSSSDFSSSSESKSSYNSSSGSSSAGSSSERTGPRNSPAGPPGAYCPQSIGSSIGSVSRNNSTASGSISQSGTRPSIKSNVSKTGSNYSKHQCGQTISSAPCINLGKSPSMISKKSDTSTNNCNSAALPIFDQMTSAQISEPKSSTQCGNSVVLQPPLSSSSAHSGSNFLMDKLPIDSRGSGRCSKISSKLSSTSSLKSAFGSAFGSVAKKSCEGSAVVGNNFSNPCTNSASAISSPKNGSSSVASCKSSASNSSNSKNGINYISEVENAILKSSDAPIDIKETEEIKALGNRGIWANKSEVLNWKGPVPLCKYPINEDEEPQIIYKRVKQQLEYVQEMTIRYLRPPTPPEPGEIVIKLEPNTITAPAPPIVIRQQPPKPITPEPLIIREAPPPAPPCIGRKLITIYGQRLPPPPRKVVIERLAPLPNKPQSVLIERWLPYTQSKRRVIFQGAPPDPVVIKPKNIVVQWETPNVVVRREHKHLGVIRANPSEYVQRYNSTLKPSKELPQFVLDIKSPEGLVLAADQTNGCAVHELEGDLDALKLVDLEREGLGEYKQYLQKLTSNNTSVLNCGAGAPIGLRNTMGSRLSTRASLTRNSNSKTSLFRESSSSFGTPKYSSSFGTPKPSILKNSNSVTSFAVLSFEDLFKTLNTDAQGTVDLDEAAREIVKMNNRLGKYDDDAIRSFITRFRSFGINSDNRVNLKEFKSAFLTNF